MSHTASLRAGKPQDGAGTHRCHSLQRIQYFQRHNDLFTSYQSWLQSDYQQYLRARRGRLTYQYHQEIRQNFVNHANNAINHTDEAIDYISIVKNTLTALLKAHLQHCLLSALINISEQTIHHEIIRLNAFLTAL